MSALPNAPTLLVYKTMQFLIMDAPSDSNIQSYIRELQKNNVKDVIRVCDPTYSADTMERQGIKVHDWPFPDGDPPPQHIVNDWLHLLYMRFPKGEKPKACIAVHCVAGLGRAPVLVAIALIEAGMSSEDAIEMIRNKRRGAINNRQLKYLQKYRPQANSAACCNIM
eukprot:Clim_evm9s246 gene=Clim_evmTU9s246